MKKLVLAVPLLALALGDRRVCDEEVRRTEVGQVDNKVDTLSKSLEESRAHACQRVEDRRSRSEGCGPLIRAPLRQARAPMPPVPPPLR